MSLKKVQNILDVNQCTEVFEKLTKPVDNEFAKDVHTKEGSIISQCIFHLQLNGINTIREDLADVGGIRLAHDAYAKWAANNTEEPKLPGFQQYSAKQMFWIASASTWCTKSTPDDIVRQINMDEHTIEKFRVIGMAANTPEFAKDFNCQATSMMNPVKRCNIWR